MDKLKTPTYNTVALAIYSNGQTNNTNIQWFLK